MLKIFFGHIWNLEIQPEDWIRYGLSSSSIVTEDSVCKEIIKEIDGSDAISGDLVISPILGGIPLVRVSTGCLAVIFMYKYKPKRDIYEGTDAIVNLVKCGDNCIHSIVRVGMLKDVVVSSSMFYNVYKYGYEGKVLVLNDHSYVDNAVELNDKWFEFREEELNVR